MPLSPTRRHVSSEKSAQSKNPPSPAAFRAGLILSYMGDSNVPLTISDIASRLSLPKSSVFNLLVSLEASGMVCRKEYGWLLSYRVVELSSAMLASSDLVVRFGRFSPKLTALRSETTLLAVLDGLDVVYLARNGGTQTGRFFSTVGSRTPAVVTGLGRAMLANLSDAELEATLSGITDLPQRTGRSHRSVEALYADLMRTRERGFAVDDEQGLVGVTCVAVAFTAEGMSTAVSATLPTQRATPEKRARLASELSILSMHLGDQERQ